MPCFPPIRETTDPKPKPVAPAVMVGEEIVVEGSDVDSFELESAICRQLDLPPPEREGGGILKKLFKS
jgi:hypothetical protein